jgi:hypothetical protein
MDDEEDEAWASSFSFVRCPNRTEQMCWLPKNYNTHNLSLSRKKLQKNAQKIVSHFVQLFSKKVFDKF